MPTAAKTHGRTIHRKRGGHRYNQRQRGYDWWWEINSKRWLKEAIAASGNPWCRICGKAPATEVDHIIPPSRFHAYGTSRFVRAFRDVSNWQPACSVCNAAKGNRMPGRSAASPVHVVYGPPGSGKTSYVAAHRGMADFVWDIDAIAASLNPDWQRHADRPDDVGLLLTWLRGALVEALQRGILNRTCWLIVTDETAAKAVAGALGASLVRCDANSAAVPTP